MAVISHAYWQRQFAGADDVLTVISGSTACATPSSASCHQISHFWIRPLGSGSLRRSAPTDLEESRYSQSYQGMARLAPGVTTSRAQSQLDALNARISNAPAP